MIFQNDKFDLKIKLKNLSKQFLNPNIIQNLFSY